MIYVLIASSLLGLAAPFIWSAIWRVPFSFLSVASFLRTVITTALTALLFGSITHWLLGFLSIETNVRSWIALATALLCGGFLLLSSARRLRYARALALLCQRAQEPDVQETAVDHIATILKTERTKDTKRHAGLVLMIAGPLTQAECWQPTIDLLQTIDRNSLDAEHDAIRAQTLATSSLYVGQFDEAAKALHSVPRPAPNEIEVWLLAVEAWLNALDGNAEKALSHVGKQATEENPSLKASHRIIRAHALAGTKNTAAARNELQSLLGEAGAAGLRRLIQPEGPASSLATAMLSEDV